MDLFRQGFRSNAVFLLMSELDQDSGGGSYLEAALLHAHFLGLRDQFKFTLWARRRGENHGG